MQVWRPLIFQIFRNLPCLILKKPLFIYSEFYYKSQLAHPRQFTDDVDDDLKKHRSSPGALHWKDDRMTICGNFHFGEASRVTAGHVHHYPPCNEFHFHYANEFKYRRNLQTKDAIYYFLSLKTTADRRSKLYIFMACMFVSHTLHQSRMAPVMYYKITCTTMMISSYFFCRIFLYLRKKKYWKFSCWDRYNVMDEISWEMCNIVWLTHSR